jgi:hypothetical protein
MHFAGLWLREIHQRHLLSNTVGSPSKPRAAAVESDKNVFLFNKGFN